MGTHHVKAKCASSFVAGIFVIDSGTWTRVSIAGSVISGGVFKECYFENCVITNDSERENCAYKACVFDGVSVPADQLVGS